MERRVLTGTPGQANSVFSIPVSTDSKDTSKESETMSYNNPVGTNAVKDIDTDTKDRVKLKSVKSGHEIKTGINVNNTENRTMSSVEKDSTKVSEFMINGDMDISKDSKVKVENELRIDVVTDSVS